jgi:hypothetical protein
MHQKQYYKAWNYETTAEWKKFFASYTSDKGLMPLIYREVKKLNFQKINDQWRNVQMKWTELFQRKKSKWLKNA